MFHCFRRGCDNICSMTKDTYIIRKDPKTGLRYVTKVIEEMKNNHRECGKENIASIMPQTPGMCNRLSCNTIWKVFYMCTEKYLISILMWNLFFHSGSPLCLVKVLSCKSVHYTQNLTVFGSVSWFPSWTACSLVFQSTIWFKNVDHVYVRSKQETWPWSDLHKSFHTGHWTNTFVKRNDGPSQTMAVAGHKSVQSLTVYPRVDKEEKIMIWHSNFEAILRSAGKQLALPAPTIIAFPSSS